MYSNLRFLSKLDSSFFGRWFWGKILTINQLMRCGRTLVKMLRIRVTTTHFYIVDGLIISNFCVPFVGGVLGSKVISRGPFAWMALKICGVSVWWLVHHCLFSKEHNMRILPLTFHI